MELDEQSLLHSLIKDSADESLNSTSYLPYLQTLFTYDTERLHREIEYLNDEKSTKSSQMLSLTFDNYSTFIQTAECSKNISNDFSTIEDRLTLILTQLEQFSSCCQTFIRETEQTNAQRKQNMFTLQKYPQLLEILEIPQLMDTCVRNDYFDEALEIVTYCKRLERKFSLPVNRQSSSTSHLHIPLIVHIVHDVRLSLEYMLEQLVAQLQTAIQLPACLRIMGFIRRMDIYNELELRLCFLQSRTYFLQKRLNVIQQQYSSSNFIVDHYEHASKYIDETRNILFDIVTQYRALFSDDDTTLYVTFNRNEYVKETNLFRSWLVFRLTEFLRVLEIDLKHCTGKIYVGNTRLSSTLIDIEFVLT
jgi:conserved oligomeric Golgi complex subunit 8